MHLVDMAAIDWVVLITYLSVVVLIGVIASRRVKNTENYFLGNRGFGKIVMIAQSFGTGTHAEMPVSLAGAVYTSGLPGIWYQWKNLFVTPFYWLMAPLFRRFRRTTTTEVVEDRYGPWMGGLYTVFALLFFMINLAGMLKGAGKVLEQSTGGMLPVNGIVAGMTCIFILYSLVGGLVATAWTEVLQGFLILTLSFMLIPLGWHLIGGVHGMRATLSPDKLSLVAPAGIGIGFVVMLTLNGMVGIIAQPHLIATVGTGRDEHACRVGQFYGNFVKRFCTVGWAFVGLITAVLIARGTFGITKLSDPEESFGFACRHLLFPGGIGLLIASILATNMAGCSAFMVDSGALVTNGLVRKFMATHRGDHFYLRVGRISGLLVTLASAAYAVFLIKGVLYSFLLTETMSTYVGISLLAGVVWRRANRWGALTSVVASMGANFAGYAYMHRRLDAWDPWVFGFSLAVGAVALVVVSLLTPPEPGHRLEEFFGRLHTPSGGDTSAHSTEAVAKAGRQLILVNLTHPRKGAAGHPVLHAYREDLRGFLIGWVIVGVLIGGVWLVIG